MNNFQLIIIIPLGQLKVAILKWPIPLADSAELATFYENWPFFGISAISEYIMYIKD